MKRDHDGRGEVVEGAGSGCVNFHRTKTILVCTCSGKPKLTLRPINELPAWMVGGEAPQE